MSSESAIEWTESTWNPITGCTKTSAGCKNCYAERIAYRLQAMGQPNYKNGFQLTLHEEALSIPLTWRKPRIVFVNSMSDLFHQAIPFEFIEKAFDVMCSTPRHTYQILTKRSHRLMQLSPRLPWPTNVWMGVSVESEAYTFRLEHLRAVNSSVRFVSFEPLLGPIANLDLSDIHWAIAGGESGPNARPMKPSWARVIRDQCKAADVPFFFKQWGGVNKKKAGRVLDGKIWDQIPCTDNALFALSAS